jgi:ABC-2 type transport system permease protein
VVASVARNLLSAAVVLVVAFAIGFRPHGDATAWLAAAGILALFVLALSWLAAAIGIVARSPEAAQGVAFLVSFFPYVSSAFVPVHTMPAALRTVANHQPATAVVDSLRALLNGGHVGASAWEAVVWSVGMIIVSIALAGILFRRRAR